MMAKTFTYLTNCFNLKLRAKPKVSLQSTNEANSTDWGRLPNPANSGPLHVAPSVPKLSDASSGRMTGWVGGKFVMWYELLATTPLPHPQPLLFFNHKIKFILLTLSIAHNTASRLKVKVITVNRFVPIVSNKIIHWLIGVSFKCLWKSAWVETFPCLFVRSICSSKSPWIFAQMCFM